MHNFGGPHSQACLEAPIGAFTGACPAGPAHKHGWGLGGVALVLREKCIASPIFLASNVLSVVWQQNLFDRPSDHHRLVERAIIEQRDLLYVGARSTAKTTLNIETGSVWQLLKFWNDSIVFFQATEPVAKSRSAQIRNHFVANPRMKALFPEYHMATGDQQGDVRNWVVPCRTILTPEGSFDIATPGASRTGNHYDVLLSSDLMNPETTPPPCGRASIEVMKSIIAWASQLDGLQKTRSVNPRAHKRHDSNRWHDGDLPGELIRKDTAETMLKVINGVTKGDDGRFISPWPEVITSDELHAIFEKPTMNSATWAANYCSDPRPDDDMGFRREDFHFYGRGQQCQCGAIHETPKKLNIRICIDPAFADGKSDKKASDRSAMVVAATAPDGNLYVLDAKAGRWGPHEFMETLFALIAFWKPRWVGMEDTGGSRGLKAMILSEMARTKRFVRYKMLKPLSGVNGGSKRARIVPLLGHAQHFGLYLKDDATQRTLIEELLRFGVTEHDDLADALAYVAKDIYDVPTRERESSDARDYTEAPRRKELTARELLDRRIRKNREGDEKPWHRVVRQLA